MKKKSFSSQHITIESSSLEEENIIKDIRRLFKLENEIKIIEGKIIWDIKNLSEHEEEENYQKPVRVSNFWSNNYLEYESSSDRNKTLPVEEYFDKIRPYLKDIINNSKNSETWKIQLTMANSFISSTDNNEEHVMHCKSDNIDIMINDEAW